MKMKKSTIITFLSCLVLFFFTAAGLLPAPQQQTEPEEVFVEVTNVEVIVRALKKGKPVGGLLESDFTLYENGQKRDITSFMEIRRKIGAATPEESETNIPTQPLKETPHEKKRFFLFYFWVYEPGDRYTETLDYFFNNIYHDGDNVLMLIENQVVKVTRKEQAAEAINRIKTLLDKIGMRTKMEHESMVRQVENLYKEAELEFNQIEVIPQQMATKDPGQDPGKRRRILERFIANYRRLWDEFRFKRINMNIDKLKGIANSLKTIEIEKWGLVFFQHDLFPQYDVDALVLDKQGSFGSDLELKRVFSDLTRELNKPSSAQDIIKTVRDSFIDANATFHLLLSSVKPSDTTTSRFVKIAPVNSEWKEVFKSISEATGGEIIEGLRPGISLAQVVNKEDIYYRLTYAPEVMDQMKRKIEVKTAKKGLDIVYNPSITLKKTTEVTIEDFSFNYPTLEFSLKNYQQLYDGNWMYGDIAVKISAIHTNGEIASFQQNFEPEEKAITASMKLTFPRGGEYSLIVEALDNQTGKKAVFSQKIEVPKTGADIPVLLTKTHEAVEGIGDKGELNAILEKTAKYCDKLKSATFYFICLEEISDIYILKGQEVKNDFYRHEYQIIMDETGRMSEERKKIDEGTLKKKRKKKAKKETELVLTNFYSYYPFLMPVTLLDREKKDTYEYRLLAKETIGSHHTKVFKISVEPKSKGRGAINHGIVWVDERDGSVIKIELNPLALRGIDTLQDVARRKGAMLEVTDIHWFEIEKDEIRFPSKTEISEIKLAINEGNTAGPEELENSKTVFNYKDYRFFNVNVDVVDSGHK